MDHIERNYKLIEQSMINQMERSFEIGRKLIDSELDAGLLNFIVKPTVKMFYSYWTDKDARIGTLKQIRVALDCGKNLILNGHSEEVIKQEIERTFPDYLEGDQTYRQCKKNHKNFKKLVEITKECYISQVKETLLLLRVDDENIASYDDLCRAVFKTRDEAYKSLMRQLDYNEAGIKIVEQDPSILKLLTGRNIIVKALRKGFEITKKELIESLNQTFN
ncbi:MAG: hypothetical protein ACTSR8_15265 [Promethearchaeota archaeon]